MFSCHGVVQGAWVFVHVILLANLSSVCCLYFFSGQRKSVLNMVKEHATHNPEGGDAELERLHSVNRMLAAEVDRKTGELFLLRLAVAEAKRLAL